MNRNGGIPIRIRAGVFALAALAAIGLIGLAGCEKKVEKKEFVFGQMIDLSGPTQTIGPFWSKGSQDYVKLFNMKNKDKGFSVRLFEVDHGYQVPRGIEAYERFKQEGAVSVSLYGTPHTISLTPRLTDDHILGTAPGFGTSAATDGTKFPYVFPVAATYWSQMGGTVKFVLDKWKESGQLGKPKIAYLFFDNPAGREPLPILEDLAQREGFQVQTFAVPPPGIDMRPQVLDITRNYKADWVIAHLFGRGPSVTIKEFARAGFPRERLISFVWGSAESDVKAAGEDISVGYYGVQFAGVGDDFDIIREIKKMYQDEGAELPKEMEISVYYNRGVFIAALHARAIELAFEQNNGVVNGENVKKAMESIQGFDLGGFLPPMNLSPQDHEGGGWVRIWQVQEGGRWAPATDWFHGYREVVLEHVAKAQ
jgi:branched-chain amino acid transport system substrate-binding protein